MRRIYIAPSIEVDELETLELIAATTPPAPENLTRNSFWFNDAASANGEAGFAVTGIEDADASSTFTGGQGYGGGGNRAKEGGNIWDSFE